MGSGNEKGPRTNWGTGESWTAPLPSNLYFNPRAADSEVRQKQVGLNSTYDIEFLQSVAS